MSDDNIETSLGPEQKPPNYARRIRIIRELMAMGYDEDTAAQYAVLIGDDPIRDQDDNVVVQENGKVLARLKLKEFKR